MCYKDHVIDNILRNVLEEKILAPCFKEKLQEILYKQLDNYFVLHCDKNELYYKLHSKKKDKVPNKSQDHLFMRLMIPAVKKEWQKRLEGVKFIP